MVRVAISVSRRVDWGESVAVVGQDTVLGSWQPCQSLPLSWSEGDVWSAVVGLPPGVHEFKVNIEMPVVHWRYINMIVNF